MPPIVASFLYVAFVIWVFRRDLRERPNVTNALWLPFFWVFISGSRFISGWLAIFGINLGAVNVEEGSPIDALFFAVIIGGGLHVLIRRRVTLNAFVLQNRWVAIYLFYCLLAIAWSDFPFVAFKRWIKLFGQPIMVLVVLTEPDPIESVTRLLKRCAYVLLPISVLYIKYYPGLGRAFDPWSGMPTNTGITTNKNALGCDCFILGLFFTWHLMRVWKLEKGTERRNELLLGIGFLGMAGWLLDQAHSSTSWGALTVAIMVLLFTGLKFLDRRRILAYLTIIALVAGVAEALFGIHDLVIEALGRNSTFTGRTEIWQVLLKWPINPVVGVGFESFWLGERSEKLLEIFAGLPLNEAHNGYLETYINLGLLGLVAVVAMVLATFAKAQRALLVDFDFGRFRIAYVVAFLCYNWTEAAFRTHAVPFYLFFLVAIDYRTQAAAAPAPAPASDLPFGGTDFPGPATAVAKGFSEDLPAGQGT
jgi:O-antigen ligase